MSEHSPECPVAEGPCCPWMGDCRCQCMCDLIKRVEVRVHEDWYETQSETWVQGYEQGVKAAREPASIRRGGLFLQHDENGQPYPVIDDEPNGPYVLYADHAVEVENVWAEAHARGFNDGRAHGERVGHAAGVDAAREAVEQASSLLQPLGPALAAIDALREEKP